MWLRSGKLKRFSLALRILSFVSTRSSNWWCPICLWAHHLHPFRLCRSPAPTLIDARHCPSSTDGTVKQGTRSPHSAVVHTSQLQDTLLPVRWPSSTSAHKTTIPKTLSELTSGLLISWFSRRRRGNGRKKTLIAVNRQVSWPLSRSCFNGIWRT